VRKSRYTDDQIADAVRQVEAGTPAVEIAAELGVSESTLGVWRKRFEAAETPELRELRQLRTENAQLAQLVAELTRDRHVCKRCANPDAEPVRVERFEAREMAVS
jgi:putative transposase